MVYSLLPYLQTIIAIANICVLGYALFKFLNRPHDTLEDRVKLIEERIQVLDIEIEKINSSLLQGNDRFRDQDTTNEVMQSCMLALIDFELSYCIHTSYTDTEDLMRAKNELRKHLASK